MPHSSWLHVTMLLVMGAVQLSAEAIRATVVFRLTMASTCR
jgi:hypothetical protein